MYTGTRISRQEFLNSHFLKVSVTDVEKNYLHHNRFVLEVVTDRSKDVARKKFSEILRFSEEVNQKLALRDLAIESHIRNSKKLEQVEMLFKKLNTAYLAVGNDPQAQAVRAQIRNYLYNLLFSNIEQLPSSEEEEQSKNNVTLASVGSPSKERHDREERPERESKERDSKERDWREGRQNTKLPNVIRNIFKPKRQSEDFRRRDLLKGIKSIWLRQKNGWAERLFSVNEDSLVLIQRTEPQQKHIIFVKYLQVAFLEQDYYRIVLTHCLLDRPIEIRTHAFEELAIDEREEYVNLLSALRESCDRGQRSAHNFVGVLLSNKKNKFMVQAEKRPAQRLNVKITHEEEVYNFTMAIDSGVFLQLPVLSNYGRFEAEVVEQREGGLIPTLSSEKSTSFTLPVQSVYDQLYNDRPKRKTPEMRSHLLESKQCNYSIRLEYFPLTSWKAYCSGEVADRFEGVDQPSEFTRGEFRIQRNRLKRILYSVEEWVGQVGALKNFEYPLRSVIFYLALLVAVIEFDANNILQYCLAGTCLLLAYLHPLSAAYCRDLVALIASSEWVKALEGGLQERRWKASFKVALRKGEEKRRFLEDFNMRKKKKRNILEKFNRLQEVLLRGQLALTEIVTLCEKAKNLFCWYHHAKTKWLFLVVLGCFLALFFLPLRALALLGLVATCHRGWQHHARVCQRNQFVVFAILRLVVDQEGLVSLKDNFDDTNRPYDRRSSDYAAFEKKAKERLAETLQLEFDPAIFLQGRTVGEVVGWLSECRDRLVIPEETCRKNRFNLEWSRRGGRLASVLTALYLLLLSVPSDRNVLEVKHDPEEQEDSDDDELP